MLCGSLLVLNRRSCGGMLCDTRMTCTGNAAWHVTNTLAFFSTRCETFGVKRVRARAAGRNMTDSFKGLGFMGEKRRMRERRGRKMEEK